MEGRGILLNRLSLQKRRELAASGSCFGVSEAVVACHTAGESEGLHQQEAVVQTSSNFMLIDKFCGLNLKMHAQSR